MKYLNNVFIIFILICRTGLSQDIVAFRKGGGFSWQGNSYFISEATFDKSKSIFPFKFLVKEMDLNGNTIKELPLGSEDFFPIENDTVNYYFEHSNSDCSSLLYKNVGTNKILITKLPYSFDHYNSFIDFHVKDRILYLIFQEHTDYLFTIDIENFKLVVKKIGFLAKFFRNNRVRSISSHDGNIFSIDYKSGNGTLGTIVVDLTLKKIVMNVFYDKNTISVVTKIVNEKLFSAVGYLSNENNVEDEKSILKILDLNTHQSLRLVDLEIDGYPEYIDVYDYGDKVRILLTYAQRNTTADAKLTSEEFEFTLNYKSYEVKLITIDNL